MKHIVIDNLSVNVIKSKRRKTVAIKVIDNVVSVHIPERLPLIIAQDFISSKTAWIRAKLLLQSQRHNTEKQFIENEKFQYLGQDYTLRLNESSGPITVSKSANDLICQGRPQHLNANSIRNALIKWYKTTATEYLTQRTRMLSAQTQLGAGEIQVKTYKSRWGSCNVKGDIQYNWKLILAPSSIIDYVIIHELCHTQHHNHSKAFWQLVEQLYPDFSVARQWLKVNGYRLEI
jgi:predicted metal-dependent hydrolase